MSDDKRERLDDVRTVRLLRAKVNELESAVRYGPQSRFETRWLAADIALVADLLADHIERHIAGAVVAGVLKPGADMPDEHHLDEALLDAARVTGRGAAGIVTEDLCDADD